LEKATRWIIDELLKIHNPSANDLRILKHEASKRHFLDCFLANSSILEKLSPLEKDKLLPILQRKKTRSLSGVNIVAVMTEPFPCPHGTCSYCPGGPEKGTPQSYTGYEPAAMRGIQNNFDPRLQVTNRMKQLEAIGHTVDKVELIIMGGTFPATPAEYQEWFVKECLDAITGNTSYSLYEAKKLAETAYVCNAGITVEARPDCLTQNKIDYLLELGTTRVEIGVQTTYDEIYQIVKRGHTSADVIRSTKLMKDSALKIVYHMMPGLPSSTPEMDLKSFKEIFSNPHYCPDMIKIYPTLVIEGTELYDWCQKGSYKPYSTNEAVEVIAKIKAITPPWIRIMRMQRDIPVQHIKAGVSKGNLRQLVKEKMKESRIECNCIRCREVGQPIMHEIKLCERKYEASGGLEYFISYEDAQRHILIGFIRLRIPSNNFHRPEINDKTALIRELHVYGEMVPVGSKQKKAWQHKGWGEKLIKEAEKIASESHDIKKMIIMSALGTKKYYQKLDYKKDGAYVSRKLI
jgi:elongator complex protein 3